VPCLRLSSESILARLGQRLQLQVAALGVPERRSSRQRYKDPSCSPRSALAAQYQPSFQFASPPRLTRGGHDDDGSLNGNAQRPQAKGQPPPRSGLAQRFGNGHTGFAGFIAPIW